MNKKKHIRKKMNEEQKARKLTHEEESVIIRNLTKQETALEKMEEHIAKGTSVRARQEWDINGEGPGKILLKYEEKYGQQKYMHSIIQKNYRGEIIDIIKGQQNVKEETENFQGEISSDENIYTTEQDIWEYLGNTAGQEAKKVKYNEREKMDEEITLTDIEETIKHLKTT